jgi:hypothetical protein
MKPILRLLRNIGNWAHGLLLKAEERELLANALPIGTTVDLSHCQCPYKDAHEGVWKIERYNLDANDYKIVRISDGKCDFALRESMRLTSEKGSVKQ